MPHLSRLSSPHRSEPIQPKRSNNTQSNRQRLLRFDGSRYTTPGQHQTRQQCHFHAVRLAIAYTEAAEAVLLGRQ